MKLRWTDSEDIALALLERFPTQDPLAIRFTDLRNWVVGLPEFEDDPARCNEKILEAIQMAWYDETLS